jgi:hypothetical protein
LTRLLDARTSQNASYEHSINTGTGTSPTQFGQVGLQVMNPGGIIRVDLHATMTISFPADTLNITILIQIVRGTQITDPLVYSANLTIPQLGAGPLIFPFTVTGSDYNVPSPINNQLIYTAFVSSNSPLTSRIGPESFNAAAYSDF